MGKRDSAGSDLLAPRPWPEAGLQHVLAVCRKPQPRLWTPASSGSHMAEQRTALCLMDHVVCWRTYGQHTAKAENDGCALGKEGALEKEGVWGNRSRSRSRSLCYPRLRRRGCIGPNVPAFRTEDGTHCSQPHLDPPYSRRCCVSRSQGKPEQEHRSRLAQAAAAGRACMGDPILTVLVVSTMQVIRECGDPSRRAIPSIRGEFHDFAAAAKPKCTHTHSVERIGLRNEARLI